MFSCFQFYKTKVTKLKFFTCYITFLKLQNVFHKLKFICDLKIKVWVMSKAVIVMRMQRAEWLIDFDYHFPRFFVQSQRLCHSFPALSLFMWRAEWLIAFVPHFPRFIVQSPRLCHPFAALPLFMWRAEWLITFLLPTACLCVHETSSVEVMTHRLCC